MYFHNRQNLKGPSLELKKKAKRERGGLTRRGFGLQSLNVNGHKNMSHPYLYTEQILT